MSDHSSMTKVFHQFATSARSRYYIYIIRDMCFYKNFIFVCLLYILYTILFYFIYFLYYDLVNNNKKQLDYPVAGKVARKLARKLVSPRHRESYSSGVAIGSVQAETGRPVALFYGFSRQCFRWGRFCSHGRSDTGRTRTRGPLSSASVLVARPYRPGRYFIPALKRAESTAEIFFRDSLRGHAKSAVSEFSRTSLRDARTLLTFLAMSLRALLRCARKRIPVPVYWLEVSLKAAPVYTVF